MYKCLECGNIFDEGEQVEWNERHGLDTPPYEHFSGCPICKGTYEKTIRCKDCRGEFLEDELTNGICEDCLKQYTYDFESCLDFGKCNTQEVELNCFLVSQFSEEQIEDVLTAELKKAHDLNLINFYDFIEENKDEFTEWVVKNGK